MFGYIQETRYQIDKGIGVTVAVVADLHLSALEPVIGNLKNKKPDLILIPGDLINGSAIKRVYFNTQKKAEVEKKACEYIRNTLNACGQVAPTYCSYGNHEKWLEFDLRSELERDFHNLLNCQCVKHQGLVIAGLTSAIEYNNKQKSVSMPDIEFIDVISSMAGFKILLCHHPEYYPKYLVDKNIDLIISGHAHGGQIRVFGQGLYAPGQGLLPRYTSGVYEEKLIISRGIGGTELFPPRINNKPEIVYVKI